jgi:prophage regulatory protein
MGNAIHQDGFLRLSQIIGDKKANPPIPPIIPVSATSWWNGVKSGKYPASIKLGPKTTVWRASEVLALVNGG